MIESFLLFPKAVCINHVLFSKAVNNLILLMILLAVLLLCYLIYIGTNLLGLAKINEAQLTVLNVVDLLLSGEDSREKRIISLSN
jgi:hypothetical protein